MADGDSDDDEDSDEEDDEETPKKVAVLQQLIHVAGKI